MYAVFTGFIFSLLIACVLTQRGKGVDAQENRKRQSVNIVIN
jgi:hypothetical protein